MKERKKQSILFMSTHTKHLTLLAKSKRSQSALEYMMTYGWAILIIVIVAVILYSMGIFNPSSSVTFTSSGFAPFTVSSSLCNNLGYKIAVIAGPIPNNANSLTISKVFLTSATGANTTTASYTLPSPISLTSGKTATILIPNVACPSIGTHYSLSASIQYGYSTLAGNVVENTTGTIAGTSIAGKPSVLTSYEPLTITNTQSSATPNPFQQMVNFTSSDSGWTSISTDFGQNVEFFYYNGTVIPSWLENYTSNHALWWLKVVAIPAGSSETVYVGFAPTSTNLFNTVNDGEAPQLSSTYAEYDDGADVFNFYTDFASSSLNQSVWNVFNGSGGGGRIYTGDGLNITIGNSGQAAQGEWLQTKQLFSPNTIVDTYIVGNSHSAGLMETNSSTIGGCVVLDEFNQGGCDQGLQFNGNNLEGGYACIGSQPLAVPNQTVSLVYLGSIFRVSDGYNPWYNFTESFVSCQNPSKLSLSVGYYPWADSVTARWLWVDGRAYPPNGIMPSLSFGSVA